MTLIIDGYNLLYVTGIVGRKPARKTANTRSFERSRFALLNFLADSIDPKEVPLTTVVFDAAVPLPGLPKVVRYRDMTVRFASDYDEADQLIEELVNADNSPRRLTVVSSDHRVQRAAKRRKATAVDSDVWYAQIIFDLRKREKSAESAVEKPAAPLLKEDVEYWFRLFGGESLVKKLLAEETSDDLIDPFPAGYAEEEETDDLG